MLDLVSELTEPLEWVPVAGGGESELPDGLKKRVLIHTVHDGDVVPMRFREQVDPEALQAAFVRERDWGANLVARELAWELGLDGYARVRVARVLLDFNRFPGTTPPGTTDPLERLAINPPLSHALGHREKMAALDLYDVISSQFERHLTDKLLLIGIHTYDELNPSETSRPHLSLVTLPAGYQRESRMPYGVFDPMYPDRLAESTSSRILRDRMSLDLECAGFRVSTNHPYALPEGSIEVRSQVWFFFRALRRRFEQVHPQTIEDPAYRLVWNMLLNTNLRQGQAEALRGHLQRFRKPEPGEERLFAAAVDAYEAVECFLDKSSVIDDFRYSPDRPSSLAFEVRKDLLCEIDRSGIPEPATAEMRARARTIARIMGGAIAHFLRHDRATHRPDLP